MNKIVDETWAVLELHFITRPHLARQARQELAQCIDDLRANGPEQPWMLKDIACRTIQLRYGPAPAPHN